MTEETALIFDIEKFAVHDGPGIRTVVFLKGCPLHCLWCHNPESQSFEPEILFQSSKCTLCGGCAQICPLHCHEIQNGQHVFVRENCISCGKCAEVCPAEALRLSGKSMSVPQVLAEVMKDKPFYDNSGGGITLSGGEPLAHFEFTASLLNSAKKLGLHTAIETSGFSPWEKIKSLCPVTDLWLWDWKASPEKHRELTGVSSETISDNLHRLNESGANIILRCPLIPGINDDDAELQQIADAANSLENVLEIDVEPYHPLGENKSRQLGRSDIFHASFAEKETVAHWKSFLRQRTKKAVC